MPSLSTSCLGHNAAISDSSRLKGISQSAGFDALHLRNELAISLALVIRKELGLECSAIQENRADPKGEAQQPKPTRW